jgi:hypothetical protein
MFFVTKPKSSHTFKANVTVKLYTLIDYKPNLPGYHTIKEEVVDRFLLTAEKAPVILNGFPLLHIISSKSFVLCEQP